MYTASISADTYVAVCGDDVMMMMMTITVACGLVLVCISFTAVCTEFSNTIDFVLWQY